MIASSGDLAMNLQARVEAGDGLEGYLAAADDTSAAVLQSASPLTDALLRFDLFLRQEIWTHAPPKPGMASLLFLNSYQLFTAGARMALGGHPAAAMPILRTALESACYALLMTREPPLSDVWVDRHKNAEARRRCRREFSVERAISHIRTTAPEFSEHVQALYDAAIDFGGHPNVKGVMPFVSIDDQREDGYVAVHLTSVYGADAWATRMGLVACMDFGLAIGVLIAIADGSPGDAVLQELEALSDLKNSVEAAST